MCSWRSKMAKTCCNALAACARYIIDILRQLQKMCQSLHALMTAKAEANNLTHCMTVLQRLVNTLLFG